MEVAKPFSNISEIVSKFTKACKWTSIGVFPSENSVQYQYQHLKANDKEETEGEGLKIHPQPVEVLTKSNLSYDSEVMKVFVIVAPISLCFVQRR